MPSGHTHDRITWGCFPFMTMGVYAITQRWSLAITAGLSFLFSGFMFGPDLDIRSKQYFRWGWLRLIWLPYQEFVPHRSWFSHGPIVGTVGRMMYFGFWVWVLGSAGSAVWAIAKDYPWDYYINRITIPAAWPEDFEAGLVVTFVGLEIGAFSHYASDWISSSFKRLKRIL
jgi:uncharacterized metal-binding protein